MSCTSLRIRGPFRGPSGHDHHVREFARALHRLGVAIELREFAEWGPGRLPPALQDPWFDALARPLDARVALHCCMPHQVTPDPGRATVNYTMFEATRIPAAWVAHQRRHDLIVVPTLSSQRAWIAGGVPPAKVRVCPLGIDAALYARAHAPLPLRDEQGLPLEAYRVRFLNVSEITLRKNLLGLLRAWVRATTPRDSAVLLIKLRFERTEPFFDQFRREVAALPDQLGSGLEGAAPVLFLQDTLADADMPRLYAAATHYISLSHGEGWDQPMVEAAASGLALIAPNHSAYRAYLDPSIARLIRSREAPCAAALGAATNSLFAGLTWWDPDEEEAMAAIRDAIEGRDGPRGAARGRILRQYSWDQAAFRLLALLNELGR